jgi:hypothetical protein
VRVIRLRVPPLALASWAQLAAVVEKRIGARVKPIRLHLSRRDYEALRDAEAARDAKAAGAFFKARVGPYVAPLLRSGTAIYLTKGFAK